MGCCAALVPSTSIAGIKTKSIPKIENPKPETNRVDSPQQNIFIISNNPINRLAESSIYKFDSYIKQSIFISEKKSNRVTSQNAFAILQNRKALCLSPNFDKTLVSILNFCSNSTLQKCLLVNHFFKNLSIKKMECFASDKLMILKSGIEKLQHDINKLLFNNRAFHRSKMFEDHDYFMKINQSQNPKFCVVCCFDFKLSLNDIFGIDPWEIFTIRNIGNQVKESDLSCVAGLQYAVNYLKVEHIIVLGHSDCEGVVATTAKDNLGLTSKWVIPIMEVAKKYELELKSQKSHLKYINRLVELNVKEQVVNLCKSAVIQEVWEEQRQLLVQGWVINTCDGKIKYLAISRQEWKSIDDKFCFEFKILN